MSVKIHEVKGYNDYKNQFNSLKNLKEPLYCWFIGARVNGQSWCGDCRDSEPVIKNCLNCLKLKQDINVVSVEIEREDFKGPDCKFKSDDSINVMKVPTLLNPSLHTRLVERECMDKNKLDSFFSQAMSHK